MHNNYFFIRHLSQEIGEEITGGILYESFSQQKDEAVLIFQKKNKESFILQAHLTGSFSCLHFPLTINRAKRNTASLFAEIESKKILSVEQFRNERAFKILFEGGFFLTFKLYGNRANIILYKDDKVHHLFKKSLSQDLELSADLNREIDLSYEKLAEQDWNLKKAFFTLGDLGFQYLVSKGYQEIDTASKYSLLQETLVYLEKPKFFLIEIDKRVYLSVFSYGTIIKEYSNALPCITQFYYSHFRFNYLEELRDTAHKKLVVERKHLSAAVSKSATRLQELKYEIPPGKLADIIMANLYNIPEGALTVKLFDFYQDKEIDIKLKKNIKPQKYAEILYKKGKNRHVEEGNLEEYILRKEKDLKKINNDIELLQKAQSHKEIDNIFNKYLNNKKATEDPEHSRFKTCEFAGFKIFVGKSAENNDELTQKFAHKDDLWLHAKDVTGSHVIVQHQSGKNFPKNVIEKAASLAAFYSKRKNDSLCPVQYTLKKYVRKVKGAAKGKVKIERENVLMVVPGDF